jgi:hypothetical protein
VTIEFDKQSQDGPIARTTLASRPRHRTTRQTENPRLLDQKIVRVLRVEGIPASSENAAAARNRDQVLSATGIANTTAHTSQGFPAVTDVPGVYGGSTDPLWWLDSSFCRVERKGKTPRRLPTLPQQHARCTLRAPRYEKARAQQGRHSAKSDLSPQLYASAAGGGHYE